MRQDTSDRHALLRFFRGRIREAAQVQRAPLREETADYLAEVLAGAGTPGGGPPRETFAELRVSAVLAEPSEAPERWRRLGEGALVAAGCFAPALARRNVSRSYCAAMGAAAFGVLGALSALAPRRAAFSQVAEGFEVCADVLAQASGEGDDEDLLLRLWNAWAQTRSPRLAACLRARGIDPEGLPSA